jgi:broad specificity phosphatase PhoE
MPEPTKQDAQILLTLMELDMSEPMREARKWLRTQPEGLSLDEFEAKFPRGSDGWESLTNLAIYWETVGSLIRRGLLDEGLAFDTFLDAPPWAKLKGIVLGRRAKENAPAEGENLEWVAGRARSWVDRRAATIRKTGSARSRKRRGK